MARLLHQKLIEQGSKGNFDSKMKQKELEVRKTQIVSNEITIRCDSLQVKFDRELNKLSDYQILEISQDKCLMTEFNEILEKVSSLATMVVSLGNMGQAMLDTVTAKRDLLVASKTNFEYQLKNILTIRDITPDKLKNASTLKIELSRFSGYSGPIDIYTFKSEFQKLIEPNVQKKYLADYLKKNFLTGAALNLVEKETEYDKIWNRLLDSYGNAKLYAAK